MGTDAEALVQTIWRQTHAEIAADRLVRRALTETQSCALLPGTFSVVALGKAGSAMLDGVLAARGDDVVGGMVIGTSSAEFSSDLPSHIEVYVGDHPTPGPASFAAGRRLLAWAREAAARAVPVLVLMSGGSSACCEVPADTISDEELMIAHHALVASGLPIAEINAARGRLSALKHGGLADALGDALRAVFILSDVPSGGPASVGSGPCFYDHRAVTPAALAQLSPTLRARLRERVPERPLSTKVHTTVLASPETLLHVAQEAARALGVTSISCLPPSHHGCGPLADRLCASLAPGAGLFLTTGEVGIALPAPHRVGRGGRAQHLLLELAHRAPPLGDWAAMAVASDGRDGSAGAGGVLTPATLRALAPDELSAALSSFSSGALFSRVGAQIAEFPARSNLTDLYMGLGLA